MFLSCMFGVWLSVGKHLLFLILATVLMYTYKVRNACIFTSHMADCTLFWSGVTLVVCWACCPAWCSVVGSILLWGEFFPIEGIFPLELTWVLTPFPQSAFGLEYKPRSSLCIHAFHRTDSKDRDIYVLDGWMPATRTHPACTTREDGMWLPGRVAYV